MGYTIQQADVAQRAKDMLKQLRREVRQNADERAATLAAYPLTTDYVLDQVHADAARWQVRLAPLSANAAAVRAAALAVGGQEYHDDFDARYAELNQAANTLAAATALNLAARLAAVSDGLPAELSF